METTINIGLMKIMAIKEIDGIRIIIQTNGSSEIPQQVLIPFEKGLEFGGMIHQMCISESCEGSEDNNPDPPKRGMG